MITQLLGFAAAIFTTSAFLPQAIKIVRTGNSEHLSLWMLLLQGTGNFLWCFYGYFIHSAAVLLANIITTLLVAFILISKIRHRQNKKAAS